MNTHRRLGKNLAGPYIRRYLWPFLAALACLLGAYHALMADFERRQLGGLRFLPGVTDAEIEPRGPSLEAFLLGQIDFDRALDLQRVGEGCGH